MDAVCLMLGTAFFVFSARLVARGVGRMSS